MTEGNHVKMMGSKSPACQEALPKNVQKNLKPKSGDSNFSSMSLITFDNYQNILQGLNKRFANN
jgi:hypothetical protein